jgi:polysaccharide export outer membrane protein
MARLLVVIAAVFVIIVSTTSCAGIKNFQYLQGEYDTARISQIQVPEAVIQKGDLLGIEVYSDDPLSTAAVTRQSSSSPIPMSIESANTSLRTIGTGFLVNQRGYLELYKLGTIHAEGLTKEKLADTLEALYTSYGLLKNPYVEIRFLNYKVTVIGEVNQPGPYTIPVDKVTIFEAIGLAGDISAFGRRDNVLVIRETNGRRNFARLDLSKPEVFLSPYYYLQQNDMVFVDVSKNKATLNNQNTLQQISVFATIISLGAVIYSIIRNN